MKTHASASSGNNMTRYGAEILATGENSPKQNSPIGALNPSDVCLREDIGNTGNIPTRRPLLSTRRGAGVRSERTSVADNKYLRFMGRLQPQ